MSVDSKATQQRRSPTLRIALGITALLLLLGLARASGPAVQHFAAWVDELGVWGPLAFVTGYALAVVALVPGALLTLSGGALFGLLWGSVYVFAAAFLGSALAFLVARYLARGAVERRLQAHGRFAAIDRAVGDQGLKIIFLLRLSPVFPFNLLNFALGLTRVRLGDYLLASFGMIPGTILYVYYGKLIGDLAALAGGARADRSAAYYALMGVGLVATIAVTAIITRLAKRALSEATGSAAGSGEGGDLVDSAS